MVENTDRQSPLLKLRDYVSILSNQILIGTRHSHEAGAVLICTLVVVVRTLFAAGGKLLLKASKYRIKH
jgi:hypothetical protein